MFPVLPSMAVPEGAIVVIGMDWGDKPNPSLGELAELWPEHTVSMFPADKVPVSNAIIGCEERTTGQALRLPAIEAGAKRVFVYRAERIPTEQHGEFEVLNGRALLDELVRYWRAFAIPGVIMKDPKRREDPPFLESPKKLALAIGAVAAITGIALVAVHVLKG